jgi:hypothetical protein
MGNVATFSYDVVIVGASFGGVSAALAASSDPKVRVVLLESSLWIGGQATSQGVTRWDEAAAKYTETTGSSCSYRALRAAIRSWYGAHATLSSAGASMKYFNPGFAAPDHPFACDPQVALTILQEMVDANRARLEVRRGVTVTAVDVHDGAVRGVTTQCATGTDTYLGTVFLDATDMGDLLPLCPGLPWTIGAESKADTGEHDAEDVAHPEWIQPITVPIALELGPENENHQIAKPPYYEELVAAQGFRVVDPDIYFVFESLTAGSDSLWNYRQFIDAKNFDDDTYRNSRTTVNVASNDYQARAIPTGSPADDAKIIEAARAVSVAFVYWLQHDCDSDDRKPARKGYPNLMIRTDTFGRADGTAPAPYVRESRRIDAETRVVQKDIDASNVPDGATRGATLFPDSCGIGWYGVDVHPATTGRVHIGTPWKGFETLPFQVPLGALLPKDLVNFVAACKNIGTTHLTSGAYRVHPIEWAIGEAAGVLAAYCVTQGVTPKDTWKNAARVQALQQRLLERGAPIFWWSDVSFEDDAQSFVAVQLLSARGLFDPGQTLEFRPNDPLSDAERATLTDRAGKPLSWPSGRMTRAQTAVWLLQQLS